METQQLKRLFASFLPVALFITTLISNSGCRKETKNANRSGIIYTDVNPDSVIVNSKLQNDTFKLDLNNNGIADFEFAKATIILCNDYWTGTVGSAIDLSVKPARGNEVMANGSGLALALDSLMSIAQDSVWATTPQILLYGAVSLSGHCQSSFSGNWLNVLDKYAGLKINENNLTYYGWARLSCSYRRAVAPNRPLIISGQLILKDYAFNSLPNQPILAGQTR